jgi:S-DNA-T family DNA segregation ATPase FtsK/SpoIIIE
MASPRPTRSRNQDKESPWNDAVGITFLVLAAMYLLALISYDARDLPAWSPLATAEEANPVATNFIGRMGAVIAGHTLWVAGLAIYLIPISLTWFGVCKLASSIKVQGRSWLGVALMVVSAAALIQVQDFLNDLTPLRGGGGLGYLIGGGLFGNLLGKLGSTVVLAGIYAVGFFLASGLHPLMVISDIRREITEAMERARVRREVAAKMAAEGANALPAATVTPRRRKPAAKDEEIRPDTMPAGPMTTPELPLAFEPPAPKIIDSSAPRAHAASDKPRLSEVWEKKRAQKIEQAPHGSLGSLTVRFKEYKLPGLDLLTWPEELAKPADKGELLQVQDTIVRTLASFGVKVEPGDITRGPAITRYEVRPVDGLRVSRIAALDSDIARATRAERINILAPIPGKDTVGIELANKDKVLVPIRELLEDDAFLNGKAKIPIALGKDVYGKTIIGDLAGMPHLLVAGATGSGKSVCINGIITSLLCRFAPDELRFIMIDPKVVEMQNYADLPHLALPVVTDPKKSLLALRWVVKEMENRYQIFAQEGCRNFEAFNNRNRKRAAANEARKAAAAAAGAAKPAPAVSAGTDDARVSASFARAAASDNADEGEAGDTLPVDMNGDWIGDSQPPPPPKQEMVIPDTLPYIVIIIDELADLMQTAPADIEVAIARITQMARAAGIHLIVATQTPRADVITGVIKANIPTRIAFQVASALDSRVILDRKGAENLVGKGDMLYVPPGGSQPIRSQGALVTDDEIHAIVECCVAQGKPIFDVRVDDESGEMMEEDGEGGGGVTAEEEETLEKCLEVIRQEKKASTSLFQRRLRLGYGRAARMMDILEDRGIIGPGEGAKPREILVDMDMM